MSILEKIMTDYYHSLNDNLPEKTDLILSTFSIKHVLPMYYIGVFNDFIENEPQFYYNKKVTQEIITNLNHLYDNNKDVFPNIFYNSLGNFFDSLSSYHGILDLHDEFDDVGIEPITKAKIYHIPLITQLMESCLNHYYRGIISIENAFTNKDYTKQKTLGQFKNILNPKYPELININIDFRNAMSHGLIKFNQETIKYSHKDKESQQEILKSLDYYDLKEMKNNLLDIASGAFLGLFLFMTQKALITDDFLGTMNEKTAFTFLKLLLHHDNIKITSYTTDVLQFSLYIAIKNIDNKGDLIHILVLVSKIMYITFKNYEDYFIYYSHTKSLDGMMTFQKEQLNTMLQTADISELDKLLVRDNSILLIPDIEINMQDNRAYKFHTFPEIKGNNWKVIYLKDISNESTKRFSANLIITQKVISKQEVEKILFLVNKKISILENKSNPKDNIKHGRLEADVIRISIFYQTKERNQFNQFIDNPSFIALVHYYKNKSTPKIAMMDKHPYRFENLKRFDIFWNKNFIDVNS